MVSWTHPSTRFVTDQFWKRQAANNQMYQQDQQQRKGDQTNGIGLITAISLGSFK